MNLINDPWIPVQYLDGSRGNIAPWQLVDVNNPVVDVVTPRPDFNGALLQFLIAIFQTCLPPLNDDEWQDWLESPPSQEKLKECMNKYVAAFELSSGDGRFMQEFGGVKGGGVSDVSRLLIDSPGENTIKNNTDHFIKRGQVEQMCFSCAAISLFALQTNANGGGSGYRASVRGIGVLTTLVDFDDESYCDIPHKLWLRVWLNVLCESEMNGLIGSNNKQGVSDMFPWMAPMRTSEKGSKTESTTPEDVHPLQMYWASPRRISLDTQELVSGRCHVCNSRSNKLIKYIRTRNYGVNYSSGIWRHPLSPYVLGKDMKLSAVSPELGGFSYRHWFDFAFEYAGGKGIPAAVVRRYMRYAGEWKEQFRLFAFGHMMDKGKVSCWYETKYPLFTMPEKMRLDFSVRVQLLVEIAEFISKCLCDAVKEAWQGRHQKITGDLGFLRQAFYEKTSGVFYRSIEGLKSGIMKDDKEILRLCHRGFCSEGRALFDFWVMYGDFSYGDPARVIMARKRFTDKMNNKWIRESLGGINDEEAEG